MSLIPVEGFESLHRDSNTNAIVNTNKQEYEAYLARKNTSKNQKQKIDSMEDELKNVKTELDEIKSMLRVLIDNHS
jgi:uncharacterized membrane protein